MALCSIAGYTTVNKTKSHHQRVHNPKEVTAGKTNIIKYRMLQKREHEGQVGIAKEEWEREEGQRSGTENENRGHEIGFINQNKKFKIYLESNGKALMDFKQETAMIIFCI